MLTVKLYLKRSMNNIHIFTLMSKLLTLLSCKIEFLQTREHITLTTKLLKVLTRSLENSILNTQVKKLLLSISEMQRQELTILLTVCLSSNPLERMLH